MGKPGNTSSAHELIRGVEQHQLSDGHTYIREHCNSYVDTSVLHSAQDVHAMIDSHRILATNIPLDLHQFIDELAAFSESHHHQAKESRVRYGRLFIFMLPRKFTKKEFTKLSYKISEYYGSCPFFSYPIKQGKAHCLCIYCADRYYYPEAQPLNVCTAHDRYFNKKTGRICSKGDPDAVLRHKKGDILSTEMAHFSYKIESLIMFDGKDTQKSRAHFRKLINDLKHWYYDVLRDDFGFEIIEGAAFRKIRESDYKDKERKCAEAWNSTFSYMEDKVNTLITGAKECGLYRDYKKEIYEFIFHMKKALENDGYIPKNKDTKISFGIYRYNELHETIGLNNQFNLSSCQRVLLNHFNTRFKTLSKLIFGVKPEVCFI